MEPTDTQTTPVDEMVEVGSIDVAELRDLLSMLKEFEVSAFQMGGMSVTFHEPQNCGFTGSPKKLEDDGHSTSTKRVEGFGGPVYRDPRLWAHQNGKSIKFDGSMTE